MKKNFALSCMASRAVCAATVLGFAVLVGCTSDDPSSRAINTGTYPNLNIKPASATTQLSQEERDSAVASLKGAAAGQTASGRGAGASANEAELRRLGATHSEEALKEICAPRPTC